jgi:hypothetical protein
VHLHGTRASSHGEGSVRVSTVFVHSIFDHVGDGLTVTTTVVLQCCSPRVSFPPIKLRLDVINHRPKYHLLASDATSKQPPLDLEFGKIKMMPCLSA